MFQQIVIIGNLGNDPEMRYTPSGTAVTNMSVAVNRTYTKDGEKHQDTTWFRVSAWGKQAESCDKYLSKGRKVMVVGRIVADEQTGGPRVYEKKDGTAGSNFEINASQVIFLDPVSATPTAVAGAASGDFDDEDYGQEPVF